MSLSVTKLRDEFLPMFDPGAGGFYWSSTRSEALDRIRDAYDTYASDAEDYSGDSVASKSPSGFRSALNAMLSTWTAADAAAAMAAAFVAYWTGGSFAVGSLISGTGSPPCANQGSGTKIFAVENTSAVIAAVGTSLQAALLSEFNNLSTDGAAKALAIAQCFHNATTADVTVLISGLDTTPPPTGPLPVTNTCTVF